MKREVRTLRETAAIAREALAAFGREKRKGALVIVCSGNLGAGKTAFVKALARSLGVRETVTSPTFVLLKVYNLPKAAKRKFGLARLVHIDAYRLERPRELLALGFKALSKDRGNIIVVEWGEKMKRLLPRGYRHLYFEFLGETRRAVTRKK